MRFYLKIIELLSKWNNTIPYFYEMISFFIGILLFAILIVVIVRIRKSDILEIPFLGIKLSSDQKYLQLKNTYEKITQQFRDLNEDSRQKNTILKLINSVNEGNSCIA